MSNSIQFDAPDGDVEIFQLASGSAWTDFCAWARPLAGYNYLAQLTLKGTVTDTLGLSNDLGQALDWFGSGLDPNTLSVAEHLYKNIGVGDSEETATVLGH